MEKDIKNTITDIKQSIRHLATLGVPTKQLIDATKAIEEEIVESEDERIRKTLMAVVNLYYGEGEDEEKKACLYWLENQGEYKKFRDSIQVGDKVTRNEDGELVNLSQLNRVAKKDEKQGEQKPTESIWHDMTENPQGDENDRTLVVFEDGYSTTSNALLHIGFGTSKPYKWAYVNDILRLTSNAKQSEQKPANWLQELEDKLANATPQQLAEWKEKYFKEEPAWSGTDIMYLENLIAMVDAKEYPEYIKWLISIRDRVQPQPKQEWSDEDNEHIKSIISTIECSKAQFPNSPAVLEAYNSDLIWLKSLRPQKQWKPTEEQIRVVARLRHCLLEDVRGNDVVILDNLLEQLKAL